MSICPYRNDLVQMQTQVGTNENVASLSILLILQDCYIHHIPTE